MRSVAFLVPFLVFGTSSDGSSSSRSAIVASDSPICSSVGSDILLKHGSAVDAAIATLLCLGVVIPESMGIGGGFLMTIYTKQSGRVAVLDAREVAPLKANSNMFNGSPTASRFGGRAIAVPGSLSGMQEAHRHYGVLPWSKLFEPAIELSQNGFPVGEHMVKAIHRIQGNLSSFQDLRKLLWHSKANRFYEKGDIMTNPKLSKTLSQLARDGADSFYNGDIANKLARDIERANGIITKEDLAFYKPVWSSPIQVELAGGITMNSFPLPGSGGILAFILDVMGGYKHKPLESLQDKVLFYHRAIETFKFAYARKMGLEDSTDPSVTNLMKKLTSGEEAELIRQQIDDSRTFGNIYHYEMENQFSENIINDHGTSHLSVVADNGDAVSVTSTINNFFGSLLISPSTGILLNDEMGDFSPPNINNSFGVPYTKKNLIYPGRRPLSSMVPSIFLDENKDVKLVIGASGGPKITTAVALVCMRTLWLNESIIDAINEPRLHNQLIPIYTDIDENFPQGIKEGLMKLGHSLQSHGTMESGVVGILRGEDGLLYGATDDRKGGGVSSFIR